MDAGPLATGGHGDDRVVRPAVTEGAVGELGGEVGVPAVQPQLPQDPGEHEVGVRVGPVYRRDRLVRRLTGLVHQRPATARRAGTPALVAGALRSSLPAHAKPSPGSGRTPRAQASAGIGFLPAAR